jgi:threonine dehydrogenase-like Zn-dependent dehydrogenase
MVMGHEIAGEIVQLGRKVVGLREGQRVAVQPIIFCGKCEMCKLGKTSVCLRKRMVGVNMGTVGGLAEQIAVPASSVFVVPAALPPELACLAEPFAVGVSAAAAAAPKAKETVVIVGAGIIGLTILLALRQRGCKKAFIVDQSVRKLKIAKSLGAIPVNFRGENPVERILNDTKGRGVDISIEAVGMAASVQTALAATKTGGRSIWIGNAAKMVDLDMQDVVTREKSIQGVYCYTNDDFAGAVRFITKNRAAVSAFVDETVRLENAPALFSQLARGEKEYMRAVVAP